MLAGTRQHHPNRRARCNAAPAHHLHAHATPAAEGRNSTPLGNAQDSRHVEFRYPAPRRAWREVRSQRRPPLALRRPSSCQAVLPESEGGGFLDLYPHRGSLCRISSVVRSGRASRLHVLNLDASKAAHHATTREGFDVESARRENFCPALLAVAERPMVFACWGSLSFGCGTRNPPQICAWQNPRPSPLFLEPPACICFSAVYVWKESLGFAASQRQESCCLNTTTPCVDHGGRRVVVDCAPLMSP